MPFIESTVESTAQRDALRPKLLSGELRLPATGKEAAG